MKKYIEEISNSIKELNSYQAGKSIEEVREEYDLEKIVKLASNENPLGPSLKVIDAIQAEAKNVSLYPDSNSRQLKSSLAEKYQLDNDKIFIANGSDEILDLLMTLILKPGDEVIQADPSFIKYELSVKSRGGNTVKVELDQDYKHDLKAMQAAVNDKTKIVLICNPNNPTGTVVAKEKIEKFLAELSEDVLVVVDQAYQEYISQENPFDGINLLEKHSNLLLMRTFSKVYGLAGMRVGYALGNEEIIDYLNKIRGPFNVNSLAQKAAVAALESEAHLKTCQKLNEREKEFLYQRLNELGLEYIETESNFMMVNLEMSAAKVFEKLQEKGVIIRSGVHFGMENWIRVTVGNRADNEYFIRNLKKVLAENNI